MAQCREGWHLTQEPALDAQAPTVEQRAQLTTRADLVSRYRDAIQAGQVEDAEELREAIRDTDEKLRQLGVRGRMPAPERPARSPSKRSTRRRQDAPNLPTRRISKTTVGREYAGRYRPSMFITLTCDSYGRVRQDGTPVDPPSCDYRRAARDAVHFASLADRWWQNLRRAVGWDVQYFATVEPQRRAAPHLHTALRGSIPHEVIRQVTAATYHQVWWPAHDHPVYTEGRLPVWAPSVKGFVDPDTRQPLISWAQALETVEEPAHVVADWASLKGKKKKGRPYGVRWVTERKSHSEWYATKALANSRRSELMQAAREGEPFDVDSGLPVTELKRRNSLSFIEFAQSYMDIKWPDAAAKTRTSTVDALATAATRFVRDAAGRPEVTDLRRMLTSTLLPPTTRNDEVSPEDREVVDWITRHSRPLYDLADVVAIREMLDSLATRLDGKSAAATVYRRKRAVLFNMLSYAVERELLPDNPMTKVKRTAPKMVEEVDPRVVANPAQVRQLLTAVTYVGRRNLDRGAQLTAFFAVGYYAAARPAEGLALRERDCTLPAHGWGQLTFGESRPAAGKRWTDSGEVHDRRGLKHRGKKDVRLMQIPPVLVGLLREHLERFGAGPDGRLFRTPSGGVVSSSTYSRVWDEARKYALTPSQVASPLAGRPYDLRHAAVSLWLNRGVPAPEVAQRAGHSVGVLLKVYAKCIEGDRVKINKVVEDAFAE